MRCGRAAQTWSIRRELRVLVRACRGLVVRPRQLRPQADATPLCLLSPPGPQDLLVQSLLPPLSARATQGHLVRWLAGAGPRVRCRFVWSCASNNWLWLKRSCPSSTLTAHLAHLDRLAGHRARTPRVTASGSLPPAALVHPLASSSQGQAQRHRRVVIERRLSRSLPC